MGSRYCRVARWCRSPLELAAGSGRATAQGDAQAHRRAHAQVRMRIACWQACPLRSIAPPHQQHKPHQSRRSPALRILQRFDSRRPRLTPPHWLMCLPAGNLPPQNIPPAASCSEMHAELAPSIAHLFASATPPRKNTCPILAVVHLRPVPTERLHIARRRTAAGPAVPCTAADPPHP